MNDQSHTDTAITGIQEVARFLWSLAALLAPWLVPLAPAVFFGWTIYQTATNDGMIEPFPIIAAVAAAVGLETVNIAANHAMLKLSHNYKQHGGKFALSILFIAVYVVIGIVAMASLDVSQGVRIIGIGMFLLAPVAIGAQALTMDLVRVKEEGHKREQVEIENRQWQRAQIEKDKDREFQERLARLEANTQVRIERERLKASTKPAQSQHEPIECGQCGRSFGSMQALNAHRRFCAEHNGKEPAPEQLEVS